MVEKKSGLIKIDELAKRKNSPFCHFERSEKSLEL